MVTVRLTFRAAGRFVVRDFTVDRCPTAAQLRRGYDLGAVHVQVARGRGSFVRVPRGGL